MRPKLVNSVRSLRKARIDRLLAALEAKQAPVLIQELAEELRVDRKTIAALISNIAKYDLGLIVKTETKEIRKPKPTQSRFHWVSRYSLNRCYEKPIQVISMAGNIQETIEKQRKGNIWTALMQF